MTPRGKEDVSIDILKEKETSNDVDKDDNNKETKKKNLDSLHGDSLCTFSC